MATTIEHKVLIKGAPEIVMDMCDDFAAPRTDIEAKLLEYQSKGMRTLGFAVSSFPLTGSLPTGEGGGRGRFLGIAAISDPVRDDVPAAIEECLHAGIRINIVTGDTPATAKEIARQIGLENPNIITGPEFAALSDEEVKEFCKGTLSASLFPLHGERCPQDRKGSSYGKAKLVTVVVASKAI